jgi:hypothetical protein
LVDVGRRGWSEQLAAHLARQVAAPRALTCLHR